MKIFLIVLFMLADFAISAEHGIYLKILENSSEPIEKVVEQINLKVRATGYTVLAQKELSGPDLIHNADEKKCGYRGFVLVLEDTEYIKFLSSLGKKYMAAAFLKVGIYETENGVQVNLADPETMSRIVLNDLEDSKYGKAIKQVTTFKNKLIATIQQVPTGTKVSKAQEPIRSTDDLREASKDMFMMVGPMTFFEDEDQFPVIYSEKVQDAKQDIQNLIKRVQRNLLSFQPTEDDTEYQWTPNKTDLKWILTGMLFSPDSTAALLGISRNRTEALSFLIAGQPREEEKNICPGIDHVAAFPIEVLIYAQKGKIVMRTAREMFRMDMYFWDAGKMAFMKYVNLPKMLDNSIKKALLGGN